MISDKFCGCNREKKLYWCFYLLSNKNLWFSSNKPTVKSPKTQASEKKKTKSNKKPAE